MPFDKGKKRKLIDTCGHERCYSCMFRNEACPLCARSNPGRRQMADRYTPSPQQHYEQEYRAPRLPKPPKPSLTNNCPTPPHTRRRFFLSPKALRSPFAQRRHHENRVPLSGKLHEHDWLLAFCINVEVWELLTDLRWYCVSKPTRGPRVGTQQPVCINHSITIKIF